MANNEAIQILRTKTGINNDNKELKLLNGQPLYNRQKNYLTIGNGSSKANSQPITVRKLVGYFGDNNEITGGNSETDKYGIEPNAYTLKIYNSSNNIDSKISIESHKLELITDNSTLTLDGDSGNELIGSITIKDKVDTDNINSLTVNNDGINLSSLNTTITQNLTIGGDTLNFGDSIIRQVNDGNLKTLVFSFKQ